MSEHAWVHENLDTYLAGDLTTSERERVEQHAAACDVCRRDLAEISQMEQTMNGLFPDARPSATLDERILKELNAEPLRVVKRPTVWRFVAAAAAVLVIGLLGAVTQALMIEDKTPKMVQKHEQPGVVAQSNFVAALLAEIEKELSGRSLVQDISSQRIESAQRAKEEMEEYTEKAAKLAQEIKAMKDAMLDPSKIATDDVQLKATLDKRQRDLDEIEREMKNHYKVEIKAGGQPGGGGRGKGMPSPDGEKGNLAQRITQLQETFFGYKKASVATAKTYFDNKELADANKLHKDLEEVIKSFDKDTANKLTTAEKNVLERTLKDKLPPLDVPPPGPMIPGFPMPIAPPVTPPSPQLPYYQTPDGLPVPGNGAGDKGESKGKKRDVQGQDPGQKQLGKQDESKPGDAKSGDPKSDPKDPPKQEQPEPPAETGRKIIRTGEMDFEIDSFDKAVDNITKLITTVKGGFIATINSDKLPNGKMRGSVVVRMPPQYLDKFVLDLRREMAKSGELKNQRIVSLDVTKQYTDIESRLRAARTMEDRLIQIIKIGKGEIKDLVAAEKELGVWRTKIEEMEGEIRYYANQVALSTLTIQLAEKEIQTPTAIVVTETVKMRLEVDDVAKAHQIAMQAVEEAKGRITRSELKQQAAGQLQSILCAEIPPAQKDAFREKLKKLGIVSSHEENQSQHMEGGSGNAGGLKPRQNDVHFDIMMHNTANVRPRLTADLKVATLDVPAAYARLLDAINKAKGQVRDGRLNEQDKHNVHAQLDFNVPIAEKPGIDKLLADIGPVLERINVQAPVNELSTDRKFGYTLLLRDFASIPPSKALIEIVAVTDVAAVYAKVQEAIAKSHALVADAKLNEQDKLNVHAQIDFTVMTEEKPAIDKLLKDLGTSLGRTNVDAPTKQLSTNKKFGFTLVLREFAAIPPSKATDLKVAVSDVPAAYAKILDAVAKAKGQMGDAKLNEQDRMHLTAQIAFSVPSEEKPGMDKLLGELGTMLSRNNVQAPLNQLSTPKKFGYSLDLRDFANIPPSHASALTIAASNVPGNYAKLLDAIAKAKGHISDAKLNEQDKLNVTGQVNFTIPKAEAPAIEKLFAEIGAALSRNNVQAPANELSTDSKVGYSVVLRDFANIPPRETFNLQIAMPDVSVSFRELQNAVNQARGWVTVGQLTEDNKAKAEAQFDFTVPAAERLAIEKVLTKSGAILSRTSSQAGVNDLATDQKVGYRVTLRSTASIPPREKTLIKFEVADVDSKVTDLKEIVLAGKGRILDSTVDRTESGQVAAALVFEVPFASQDTLIRQMKSAGKLVSQRTTRDQKVAENDLTTAHIIVTLTGSAPILPSEEGVGSYVRGSMYLSFKILAIIVMSVIVGLSAILPVVLLVWIGYKLYVFLFSGSTRPAPAATMVAAPAGAKLIGQEEKPAAPPANA